MGRVMGREWSKMFEFYHKQYYHQFLKNKQYLLLFVKCAVFPTNSLSLTMFLSQNEMKWIKGHSVTQSVCWQPLTMAAWVRIQASLHVMCGGQRGTGTVFPQTLWFSLYVCPCNAPYWYTHHPCWTQQVTASFKNTIKMAGGR